MILITGATGTSGPEIVRDTLAKGARVRVLARDRDKAARLLGDQVEIAQGDFTDPKSIDAALAGIERALLLTPPSPEQVKHQSLFIQAAKRARIQHIVKLSMSSAHAASNRIFAHAHGISENELRASGVAWTMLRPNFFMQNFFQMAPMIRSGAIYMPTGAGKAAFVDVRDLAAVAAATLIEPGHEGKTYEITGPESLSYADVAAIFAKVLNHPVQHIDIPLQAGKDALLKAGLPDWQAEAVNQLSQGLKEGIFAEVTPVARAVGKKEPITLEQFITEQREKFV